MPRGQRSNKQILNYSTGINTLKTCGEIMAILAAKGASAIQIEYANGQPIGMSFKINCDGQEIPFRIPANPVGVLRALKKSAPPSMQTPEQAQRVAWRIMKDYIEVQLAVVESEQAQFAEVFMGYAIVQGGQTMFQKFMQDPSRLLSAGSPESDNVIQHNFQAVNE